MPVEPVQPPASWQAYRDLLDLADRPRAWSHVGHWAIDVLSGELGEQWPQTAAAAEARDRQTLPLVGALTSLGWRTLALAEAIEWAARLRLLANAHGAADLRRDLARDVTAGRILHTGLQLETAGLAACMGWDIQLEPLLPGAARPADVIIAAPGARLVIETRVLTEAPADRTTRQWTDQAVDRLTMLAAVHRTWLEGDLGDALDEHTVRELERRIPTEALGARAGLRPELAVGSARVRLVRQEDATERLVAPGPSGDLWPRMVGVMTDKASQMAESGAEWLRLIPYNHLFLLTHWAQRPLEEKLSTLSDEIRSSLAGLMRGGVVVSSGLGHYGGHVTEDTIRNEHGVTLRRGIQPLRARETLIIPFGDPADETIDAWQQLFDAEARWLPWVLDEFGLPDLAEIFPPA